MFLIMSPTFVASILYLSALATALPKATPVIEDRQTPTSDNILQARQTPFSPAQQASAVAQCKSGDLNIPTVTDWINLQIDDWFDIFWTDVPAIYYNNHVTPPTVPYVISEIYQRDGITCTIADSCITVSLQCSDWLTPAPNGSFDAVRAYVFYNGWRALAELFYQMNVATASSEVNQISVASVIGSTFGNDTSSGGPSWDKTTSAGTPAIGGVSAILGALSFGTASSATGVIGSLLSGIVGGISLGDAAPADPRIDSINDLEGSMETLYWSLNNGLAVTYQTVLLWNNGSGGGFPQVQDLLKGGAFVDEGVGQSSLLSSIEDQTFYDNMRDGSARIFGWTAINTVWRDADVFIVYLPYNAHIPPYTNFQQSDCQALLTSHTWATPTLCEGDGMTILVGDASNPSIGPGVAPHGYSSTIDIAGVPFDYHNVMASSVGAWQHTGFNANISNPLVAGLQTGNIDVSDLGDVQSLGDLPMTTEGVFNLPVCQLFDFNSVYGFYPPNEQTNPQFWCGCLYASANSPAAPSQLFSDHISSGLTAAVKSANPCCVFDGTDYPSGCGESPS
ncbi:hypothetical protein HO173_012142 [Letharia columbiana]|uniref:Uncharacterized protein n=1 Tax=Letharia columbiana TaxID=112416 RepID=A0A8H6FH25_9LECA|nr:uncharacterized protein HO173_012142 [Letharia columbiana]KAF6227613.1 hypothetical protein HO173_012142 [Letharia columbiana]